MKPVAWKENRKITMDDLLGLEPVIAVLKDRLHPVYQLTSDLLKQHKYTCATCNDDSKCDIVKRAEALGLS